MATEHERWIEDLLSGLNRPERDRLYALLGRLKSTIRERDAFVARKTPKFEGN